MKMLKGRMTGCLMILLSFLCSRASSDVILHEGCEILPNITGRMTSTEEDSIWLVMARINSNSALLVKDRMNKLLVHLKLSDSFPETFTRVQLNLSQPLPWIQFRNHTNGLVRLHFKVERNATGIQKHVVHKNIWTTKNCSNGLPYKVLNEITPKVSFPVVPGEEFDFVLIATRPTRVWLSFSGGPKISLCWNTTRRKITPREKDAGDCASLPVVPPQRITFSWASESQPPKINGHDIKYNYNSQAQILYVSVEKGKDDEKNQAFVFVAQDLKDHLKEDVSNCSLETEDGNPKEPNWGFHLFIGFLIGALIISVILIHQL